MSECDHTQVTAHIEMNFEGCMDHGHFVPTSGYLESPGIPLNMILDSALIVIIETISSEVVKALPVRSLINYESEWEWSSEKEQLPDRAKRRIVRLIARQMFLDKVAKGSYTRDVSMATLELPID